MRAAPDVTALIGNTPLVRVQWGDDGGGEVYAKMEAANPGGSVKDRICLNMIQTAERDGRLSPGATVIEPTSGNTGIGLSLIAAVRGYRVILLMPESMTRERIDLLKAYGAEVILTPAPLGMAGAIAEARRLVEQNPGSFMPDQFANPANPEMHRRTTAPEILDAAGGRVDAFVAGVGTGGTITGVGEVLKAHNPAVHIVAVEPAASAVLSGKPAGPHRIQGIGAGFVPKVLNRSILDEIMTVTDDEAFRTKKALAEREGLLVGISSGANVFAARQIARRLGKGTRVITVLPDRGERYFSIEKYFGTA
ncbi:MAG: cysteine synthase A [Nitrospirae bacterium RIFCSPHIGHO2_01_FULL_66_17]|nr:MAG: cysteine synthase A [Nitrospirae bacterium RIFCSPHIGHO2_01_FULL_66_17]